MENISEINDSLEHIDTMIGDEIDLAEVDSVIEQIVGTRNLKIAQDSQHDQTLETKLGQLALNEKKESENGMAGKDPGEQEIDLVIKEVLEGSNGDDSSEKQETHADVIVESESQILRSEEHSKKHSHDNEDDTMQVWKDHKKHFFILSHAGKPIWSRYGDENRLAGFTGVLQGIISYMESYQGDKIKSITAGKHQILFLVKGPLYLVSISRTLEPIEFLRDQLELLHSQVLMILTSGFQRTFFKNPKFDLRSLLGGTNPLFHSLTSSFSWNYGATLKAYATLRLPLWARKASNSALLEASTSTHILFSLLLSSEKVISLVQRRKLSVESSDLFLLLNFIKASESFRQSESFSPICLPAYNSTAYLYAYVHYLDSNVCVAFFTANANAFHELKMRRTAMEQRLSKSGAFREITVSSTRGGVRVDEIFQSKPVFQSFSEENDVENGQHWSDEEDEASSETPLPSDFLEEGQTSTSKVIDEVSSSENGSSGLLHFLYRLNRWEQYISAEYSFPLVTKSLQKRLFRRYQSMRVAVVGNGKDYKGMKMFYRKDYDFNTFAWKTKEFEIYLAFDSMAEKGSAIAACNKVNRWIKQKQNELFLTSPTRLPF